ncbi:hypothetical protein ACVI1J_005162 [Bradyrhizobium diazoefficiens]
MSAEDIARGLNGRQTGGQWMCRCPAHEDRRPSLAVRDGDDGRVLVHCFAGCHPLDVIDALKACGLWETRARRFVPSRLKPPPATGNRDKARWLWQRSQPIRQTVAEAYLRGERHIHCPLPATLRYLPGNGRHPASMIAAFGFAAEPEPGVLSIRADDVVAVHLTKLTPDGRKHPDEPNKIMLGSAPGVPIIVAPMNDLLGLTITEGIEDGLSVFAATGCGAWVAGSASRMPRLATTIPDWVECVTIYADDDEAGRKNAYALSELLHRRGDVEIKVEDLP